MSPAAAATSPIGAARLLRAPSTIRERCRQLYELALDDALWHFRLNETQLAYTAQVVAGVTRRAYPTLEVPYHSRYRHFEAGGGQRLGRLSADLKPGLERARSLVDLVFVSVLLDAGAGPQWHYDEAASGQRWSRSEGLAIASFDMFCAGLFAADPSTGALRVDAAKLTTLCPAVLGQAFQVRSDNPLVGLEGRAELLHRLGTTLQASPNVFGGPDDRFRPGYLVDYCVRLGSSLRAGTLLELLVETLAPIWPGRIQLDGIPLGDVWRHPRVKGPGLTGGLVPFHKLSQWLTYSLLEPLFEAGINITDLDDLTGLPEYRNGGLLLDCGVIVPKDPSLLQTPLAADSLAVVEWRALTVVLLDALATLVRAELGVTSATFPLAKVLQGGTWAAGREIAQSLRKQGTPPLTLASDGTVF